MGRPDPEWVQDDWWIIARPAPGASEVEVISRLIAGTDQASGRLATDVVPELWDDPRFTLDDDVFGVFARATVSARPLVLADLASLMLGAVDATTRLHEALAMRRLDFTLSSQLVDFEYHFCGTSLVMETGQYSDVSENPIRNWRRRDE